MNIRAVIFAGTGLFLSMVATTVWISNDLAEIRAREEAKRLQECAAQQAATPGVAATGSAQDPAVAGGAPAAAAGQAIDPATGQPVASAAAGDARCGPEGATGAGASGAAIDPVTGQPIDPSLSAGGQQLDPVTGQPVDEFATSPDPGGVVPAQDGSFDPAAGDAVSTGF